MSTFDGFDYDRKNDIFWRKIPVVSDMSFVRSGPIYEDLQILNKWTYFDSGIKNYVSTAPLGRYLALLSDIQNEDRCSPNYEIFLAYESKRKNLFNKSGMDLVGVCVMDTINLGTAHMQYLVVNPKYRKCGVGTKMIKSIMDNFDYFTATSRSLKLVAMVNKENKPMMKLLNKFFVEYDAPNARCEVADNYKRMVAYPYAKKEKNKEREL